MSIQLFKPVIETEDPNKQAKLWAAVEFSLYLGASFDWKFQDPQSSELPIDTNTTTKKQQQRLIHNLNIEIKITKRPVVVFYSSDQRKVTPENTLMEEAFQTKTFTVHLEKGVFPTPVCAKDPKSFPDVRKFGLQLVFDESPYPPPEVWMPERRSLMVWKWVRFGARDLGPWNTSWTESCVVMQLVWVTLGYAAHLVYCVVDHERYLELGTFSINNVFENLACLQDVQESEREMYKNNVMEKKMKERRIPI